MKIAIFSDENLDVTLAMDQLLTRYSEKSPEVIFPVKINFDEFSQSVLQKCLENRVKVTAYFKDANGLEHVLKQADDITITDEPVQEVLRQLGPKDAIGIVWTDSINDHLILHTVEDLALEVWDITDGLDPIEMDDPFTNMDSDQLHDAMHKTIEVFVDMMSAYIATTVMDSIGQAVMDKIHNEIKTKEIKPFEDLE